MTLRQPESMDECIYFTRRNVKSGSVTAWVFRENCPKCGKTLMGKPRDAKTGTVKTRAKEYVCSECNYTVSKEAYEDTLTANISYKCPGCGTSGETQIPFKRKSFEGVKSLVFPCSKCSAKIPITKKMKDVGSKDEDSFDKE